MTRPAVVQGIADRPDLSSGAPHVPCVFVRVCPSEEGVQAIFRKQLLVPLPRSKQRRPEEINCLELLQATNQIETDGEENNLFIEYIF